MWDAHAHAKMNEPQCTHAGVLHEGALVTVLSNQSVFAFLTVLPCCAQFTGACHLELALVVIA